jgi:acyl carrier protein
VQLTHRLFIYATDRLTSIALPCSTHQQSNRPYIEYDKKDKVVKIIADRASLRLADMCPEHRFQELGIDDLTRMEIVMSIEEEFNIKIPEDDALKMTTVQAVIDLVYKYGDAS